MRAISFLSRPAAVLGAIIFALALLPVLDWYWVLGDPWPSITPAFTDEALYQARVDAVVEGHYAGGNPYFFEHRDSLPLVLFGGVWLNAIPQALGLPPTAALMANFIFWSLFFAFSAYWLLRKLEVPAWGAVAAVAFLYLGSYAHVWRSVNLQTVYPFYFLWCAALLSLIREPTRRQVLLLGLLTGVSFYLYTFLWQIAGITLVLLLLYAFALRARKLMRATVFAALMGGMIGLPALAYTFYASQTFPYFWESLGRLGLVETHLPMAEIVYSGGWIGFMLAFMGVLVWRVPRLRARPEYLLTVLFLAITGLGLWIAQGSNLFTGKLTETGEHVRAFIVLWLVLAEAAFAAILWRERGALTPRLRAVAALALIIAFGVSLRFAERDLAPVLPWRIHQPAWQEMQQHAGPFAWLEEHEAEPVVVWSNPDLYLATALPIYTHHYGLFAFWGTLEHLPDREVYERYLVTQYFADPTAEILKRDLEKYAGRQHAFHNAKTIERGIKLCRLGERLGIGSDCGMPRTSAELLGEQFFADLAASFEDEIKPRIYEYLAQYHVTYILKDKRHDHAYAPEALQATLVYADDRYELWRLPSL